MDTWATSSVTPLLNTHLRLKQDDPEAQARHDRLFPFDLRPQAHDIIRTWAFYTIAKAYFHFGEVPWRDIVISGHAQDARGKKISKSKGHVVTPAEMVEKYTADGLRYWSSGCKLGTDTIYDEKSLTDGKKLINKIFNATKFALRHLLEFDPVAAGGTPEPGNTGSSAQPRYSIDALLKLVTYPTDQWMLEKLRQTIERATRANDAYEFGDARLAAEEFFWGDFCDNYLEMSKGRLYGDAAVAGAHAGHDPQQLRLSAQAALFLALSAVLKLFAPALPHVAEECWSWYHARFSSGRSIHEEPWPPCGKTVADEAALKQGKLLADLVALARKWKSEHNVSLKKAASVMRVYAGDGAEAVEQLAAGVRGDLLATCGAVELEVAGGAGPDDAVGIDGLPYRVALELAPEEAG